MKIIIVRHVETVGNVKHCFNGITESKYTDFGKQMRKILCPYLKDLNEKIHFRKIYTSPTKRAYKLAKDLEEKTKLDLEVIDELKEYNFGIFDGLTPDEALALDEEHYFSWLNNHLYEKIPEGESFKEKIDRLKPFVKEIVEQNENIIIFTHGATFRGLLVLLLDLGMDDVWHIDIPLGGYALINYSNHFGTLVELSSPDYGRGTGDFTKNFNH